MDTEAFHPSNQTYTNPQPALMLSNFQHVFKPFAPRNLALSIPRHTLPIFALTTTTLLGIFYFIKSSFMLK